MTWIALGMCDGTDNPFNTVISAYLCPSDGNNQTGGTLSNTYSGRSNYACSRGDRTIGANWGENRNMRGLFFDGSIGGRITLAAVSDRTSNTMRFGAINVSKSSGADAMYKSALGGANIRGLASANCLATRGTQGMSNAANKWAIKGRRWADARAAYANFHAAVPPNGPSRYQDGNTSENNSCIRVSASSNHSGGVNVCMLDGSVRFVSETVDCGDTTRKLGYPNNNGEGRRWTGPSTHGVWGSMATPQGQETVSMP